uniref:Uncharacterized protein n=1 Tax=Amazona collaria TaxID=241587 RepID=A0A8B9ITA3_9PSIT
MLSNPRQGPHPALASLSFRGKKSLVLMVQVGILLKHLLAMDYSADIMCLSDNNCTEKIHHLQCSPRLSTTILSLVSSLPSSPLWGRRERFVLIQTICCF